ncbi:hypothetical protein LT012_20020, partial [Vibrio cholerae]|uniref:hypothetical protein n=1 Tax=Vibrio cholerae TaxID=666 RepID=UPI001E2925E5
KLILNFIGLHQKTEIKEALVANSKHHRSPYISTTFMRFPCNNCNHRGSMGLETLRVDSPS